MSGDFEINGQNKTTSSSSSLGSSIIDNPTRRVVLLLRVCAHHMSSRRDSEMAVIEVGILSGFKPNEADLKEILNDIGTPAMKYELSADRSLVVLYMKYIPYSGSYCFQFRLVRDSLVYNLQSGYIRVYEYYSPTHSCSNFYTPSRVNNLRFANVPVDHYVRQPKNSSKLATLPCTIQPALESTSSIWCVRTNTIWFHSFVSRA